MSLVTSVLQTYINTSLTEADKMEAMEESGQSRLSQRDSVSATDHSTCSINQQWLTGHSVLKRETLTLILTDNNRCLSQCSLLCWRAAYSDLKESFDWHSKKTKTDEYVAITLHRGSVLLESHLGYNRAPSINSFSDIAINFWFAFVFLKTTVFILTSGLVCCKFFPVTEYL